MTLGDLCHRADALAGYGLTYASDASPVPTVDLVTHDSRRVRPGALFVGLKGQHTDGSMFASDARRRGAVAVVSESARDPNVTIPWITVADARRALAALAVAFYGQPSHELILMGVTGTNGKTSTAYLLSAIFDRAGMRCGRLGTVGHHIGTETRAASLTTPEAPDIQRMLRELVDGGSVACAMEVSSHALALKRVEYVRVAAAVFTNLTRDHLDFHGDMASYFAAKRCLFDMLPKESTAIVNIDDPRGHLLVEAATRPVTYAIDRPADVTPGPIAATFDGLTFDVRTSRGLLRVRSPLLGRTNAYNVLAAVATATALDLPFSAIERGVADLRLVPGRMQIVSESSDDVTVLVDFAHTDDALRALLEAARPLAAGRLIIVFGCGGDRDRAKRPLMGAVAARLSDLVVVTSDNPRSEDPAAIIDEVVHGLTPAKDRQDDGHGTAAGFGTPFLTIVDRAVAIERAVRETQVGDVVIIAGKGHETYQVVGERRLPFDDAEVARAALQQRRTNSHVS